MTPESNNPAISVCLASFNGEAYIAEQVLSILQQLPENAELIISDDHSTDGTLEIINTFNDHRIRLLVNNQGSGVVNNFQNAIIHSRGAFIYLADQDDVWHPDKIELTLPFLEKHILLCHDCSLINSEGRLLNHSLFAIRDARIGIVKNIWKNSYTGCCMAFRKELLDYALPFPREAFMHDVWLGLVAESVGKAIFIQTPLIKFRRHDDTVTKTGFASTNSNTKKIKLRLLLLMYLAMRITGKVIKRAF